MLYRHKSFQKQVYWISENFPHKFLIQFYFFHARSFAQINKMNNLLNIAIKCIVIFTNNKIEISPHLWIGSLFYFPLQFLYIFMYGIHFTMWATQKWMCITLHYPVQFNAKKEENRFFHWTIGFVLVGIESLYVMILTVTLTPTHR